MERIKLRAETREEVGKEAVKKLRGQNLIPAVIYKGKNSLNIKVWAKDFWQVIHTKAGENVLVDLEIVDDAKSKAKLAAKSKNPLRTTIIKEVQYHPLKGHVLHVDFNEISLSEVLTVKVPVAVRGEAPGIKEGGVLEHVLWELDLQCLPTEIPESITVDVSSLNIGDSILVKDLPLPAGVKVLNEPEATVISVNVRRVEEVEEVKPEEAMVEPEVIMEKKPKEEEEAAAEPAKEKAVEKEKK